MFSLTSGVMEPAGAFSKVLMLLQLTKAIMNMGNRNNNTFFMTGQFLFVVEVISDGESEVGTHVFRLVGELVEMHVVTVSSVVGL